MNKHLTESASRLPLEYFQRKPFVGKDDSFCFQAAFLFSPWMAVEGKGKLPLAIDYAVPWKQSVFWQIPERGTHIAGMGRITCQPCNLAVCSDIAFGNSSDNLPNFLFQA